SLDLPPRRVEYALDLAGHTAVGSRRGRVDDQEGTCHSVIPLPEEVAAELVATEGGEHVSGTVGDAGLHRFCRGLEAELARNPVFERRAEVALLQIRPLRETDAGVERHEPALAKLQPSGELRGGRARAGSN